MLVDVYVPLLAVADLKAVARALGMSTSNRNKAELQKHVSKAVLDLARQQQYVKLIVTKQQILQAAIGADRFLFVKRTTNILLGRAMF